MKEKYFIVFLVLCLIVFVFSGCKNNTESETTTEITTELTAVATTEETTEKKEQKPTKKATEEKSTNAKVEKTTNVQVDAPVVETTKKVVPTILASKPVVTTKPVETTKKPATTKPAKPTTTKANKDEYYPALTAADMKTLEAYCKQYVESKGYTYDSSLNWDNCGYSSTVGLSGSMSSYGDKFKVGVGETPLEYAKRTVRGAVNANIYDFGDREWLSMCFLYEKTTNGWEWTVGYMA